MKTIDCYTFDEIVAQNEDGERREKIIHKYRDINVDYDWWQFVYDDFKQLAKSKGFEVNKMYFSGFYSQGDGAMFEGRLDDINLVVTNYADMFRFDVDKRILNLINKGIISVYWNVTHRGHYYHSHCSDKNFSVEFNGWGKCSNFDNIQYHLDTIEFTLEEIYHDLCHQLYKDLEAEYESLTSDESVSETLRMNEYHFDEYNNIY